MLTGVKILLTLSFFNIFEFTRTLYAKIIDYHIPFLIVF
ncbi:hypothetical protein J2X31_000015 [Flavobacterium arsenatis]|uniref:Uncharacterized protein n=1 Tax=Flavobacterium arsenatis TaxID=1484332 RepID=A0ABU1TKR4_9FLAO|nr:hypothetical protein [Flavobacterium arsenatis]